MTHFSLLIVCAISVEIFLRSSFVDRFISISTLIKKVIHIIPNNKISDHWKEIVIPKYAFKMMSSSLKILLILIFIILLFVLTDIVISDFLVFTLSLLGIIESIIFALIYFKIRTIIFHE